MALYAFSSRQVDCFEVLQAVGRVEILVINVN
jgi:hypothetical protein